MKNGNTDTMTKFFMPRRRTLLQATGAFALPGGLLAAGTAHAQDGWPSRAITYVVPFTPGGSTDVIGRVIAQKLTETLGQPVEWMHCIVHRWRYALPQARLTAPGKSFWWDGAQGLGVCGDFLGGLGVEGAWMSGHSLAATMVRRAGESVLAA